MRVKIQPSLARHYLDLLVILSIDVTTVRRRNDTVPHNQSPPTDALHGGSRTHLITPIIETGEQSCGLDVELTTSGVNRNCSALAVYQSVFI